MATDPNQTPGWHYPDYNALLSQWMQPYQTQYNAGQQGALAQLNTGSQIAQNRFNQGPYSTLSQLKTQHETAVRNMINSLAARGILHSGEKPYQTNVENQRYGQAKNDASNQLLDFLNNLQQQYASQQLSALGNLQDQQTSLAEQLAQIYQPTYTQPTPSDAPYGVDATGNPVDFSGTMGYGAGRWVQDPVSGQFTWVLDGGS